MRLIPIVILSTSLALPGIANAQAAKIKGASLAGLCAASLEFVAGSRSSAGIAQPQEMVALQRARDLYLSTPKFSQTEVEAYANAWTGRMSKDLTQATDETGRKAVVTHVGNIARDCMRKLAQQFQAAQQSGAITPSQPITPQPAPLELQPAPLELQPAPLELQPLIINPQ